MKDTYVIASVIGATITGVIIGWALFSPNGAVGVTYDEIYYPTCEELTY